MDAATPVPQLTLKDVLYVFLICFEAAVEAFPPVLLEYAQEQIYANFDGIVWEYWEIEEGHPTTPFSPPVQVTDALAKLNMCDWFASLLEKEVNNKLQAFFDATATWFQCHPSVNILLTRSPLPPRVPLHSVLLVTPRNAELGERYIMDGTGEQFGWPRETWLLCEECFWATRSDKKKFHRTVDDEYRSEVEDKGSMRYKGFREVARERMTELFAELKWDELKTMGNDERIHRVKQQAKDKFAGTYDEARRRFGKDNARG